MRKKLIGTKEERDELTAALRDAQQITDEDDPRYPESQRRIAEAEAKLPPLGRWIARDAAF